MTVPRLQTKYHSIPFGHFRKDSKGQEERCRPPGLFLGSMELEVACDNGRSGFHKGIGSIRRIPITCEETTYITYQLSQPPGMSLAGRE